MRVLTVRQPWAWAIIHGGKNVENRTQNIAGSYRGPVAIHAGRGWSHQGAFDQRVLGAVCETNHIDAPIVEAQGYLEPDMDEFHPSGVVIGVVDLVDVDRLPEPLCSPWAMDDHHHLVLRNPRALAVPIPAKGRLGLWRPDDTLLAAITAQLGEVA
jgi:hypothetical protein